MKRNETRQDNFKGFLKCRLQFGKHVITARIMASLFKAGRIMYQLEKEQVHDIIEELRKEDWFDTHDMRIRRVK